MLSHIPSVTASILLAAGTAGPATVDNAVAQRAAPPLSRDVYPAGVQSEADYATWLQAQHTAFTRGVAEDTLAVNPGGLARHANWILAYYCEPPLTRTLLGTGTPADLAALGERLGAARTLLEQAGQAELPGSARDHLECLTHFSIALQQYVESRQGQVDAEAMRLAANDLSIWLDDDRAEVREAARFVLCLLYRELGSLQQTLAILPQPTAVIESPDTATGIYARALRCRIQADLGHTVTAVALLLKLEERCSEWLPSETRSASAEAMLAWMRLGVAEGSAVPLGPVARATLERCKDDAREVLSGEDHPGLLRLHPAAPVLFVEDDAVPDALQAPPTVVEDVHEVKEAPDQQRGLSELRSDTPRRNRAQERGRERIV